MPPVDKIKDLKGSNSQDNIPLKCAFSTLLIILFEFISMNDSVSLIPKATFIKFYKSKHTCLGSNLLESEHILI